MSTLKAVSRGRLRGGGIVLVCAVLLSSSASVGFHGLSGLTAAPGPASLAAGAATSTGITNSVPMPWLSDPAGTGSAARAAPLSNSSPPDVVQTLSLGNDTMLAGNALVGNATDPQAAVYDSGTHQIFVTNFASNSVSVISDQARKIVARIAVGTEPEGIAYDNESGDLFVVDYAANTVSVIADASDRVVATIPVNPEPTGIAYDGGTNQVFVASWDTISTTGVVAVISGASDRVVTNVTVGSYPSGVAYDNLSGDLFVTNSNPGYARGTLSVISDLTDAVIGSTAVGEEPYGVAFDSTDNEVFVADQGSCTSFLGVPLGCSGGSVSVVSALNDSVVATVHNVSDPTGIVYDPTDDTMFTSEPGSCFLTCTVGRVAVISPGSNRVVVNIPVLAGSTGLAYDSRLGLVFAPNQGGGCSSLLGEVLDCVGSSVSVISATSNAVVGTIALATFPVAVVYDSGRGELFVADDAFDVVRVLSAATGAPVANVSVPALPNALAYDPNRGEVFVALGSAFGSGNVSVINDTSNTLVATIPLGVNSYPLGIAYDPARREMFVADNFHASVAVIADGNNTVVRHIPVASSPSAVAYNPDRGELYVASDTSCLYFWCSSVNVLNDTNLSVVGDVPVGADPLGLAYDRAAHELYVANDFGNLDVISTDTDEPVTNLSAAYGATSVVYDAESGVVFAAVTWLNSVVAFVGGANSELSNFGVGTDPVSLAVNPGNGTVYCANMMQGTLSEISSGAGSFRPGSLVLFAEHGLPSTRDWTVAIGNAALTTRGGTVLTAYLPNGTYPYVVDANASFRVLGMAPEGRLTVSGAVQLVSVHFVRGPIYSIAFHESGLGASTYWCVTLGSPSCAYGSTIVFTHLSPGTYNFSVEPRAGVQTFLRVGHAWIATNASSTPVPGLGAVPVRFEHAVTLSESGLPSGTLWKVVVHGQVWESIGTEITGYLLNGSYEFYLVRIAGFVGTPTAGILTVGGTSSQTVTFVPR